MKIDQIQTPAVLLDLDIMEKNLSGYAAKAKEHGKQIWPMLKTHKSLELAKAQVDHGATGFLCGTLDEVEALAAAGYQNLMYAYPVATKVSIDRVVEAAKKCNLIIRIDCEEAAEALNAGAEAAGVKINYTIIVDAGLHRFGVKPEEAGALAKKLSKYPNLVLKGVSTHPGHVYAVTSAAGLPAVCADECNTARTAKESIEAEGFAVEIVSSGSTPTFRGSIADETIGIYHPGNYIFHDTIQMSTDSARVEDCSLTVLASVISHPREGVFICDAGTKCLGLDQGAHGNASIKGFGHVIGHPELTVEGLSEEVGKLYVDGETDLKVGDKIRIIPNHACSSANFTNYLIGIRGDEVDHLIRVDIRSNSTKKGIA